MSSFLTLGRDSGAVDFLAVILRITCWPILISTIELVSCPEMIGDATLMSWEVGKLRHPYLALGWSGRFCNAFMQHAAFMRLLWLRAVLAGLLLFSPAAWLLHPATVGLMTILLFLWLKRSSYGQDGADQMMMIIWLSALVAVALGGEAAATLCVCFIAFQSCMSYTVAGFAKVRASGWRDGQFLPGVLGTTIYGTELVGGFLRRHPRCAFVGSWMVLLFEMSFSLAWILPWPWGIGYLVIGTVFHIANAFLMGLSSFLFTFVAAYPAVWFTLQRKGW